MGLFGGNDGEDELRELREQLDDIQRRQDSTPSPYASSPSTGGGLEGGLDMEGPMQLREGVTRLSPFMNWDADKINLNTILQQAQAPLPQRPQLGLPADLVGQGPQNGIEDEDLWMTLLQKGGLPGGQ